ncbi:uncharacterized protein J3R85_000214 [Psidium guajava]|nr:uncharacterized protein J3R85_000214 [Psidium guajava]
MEEALDLCPTTWSFPSSPISALACSGSGLLSETTSDSTRNEVMDPAVSGNYSLMRSLAPSVLEHEEHGGIPNDALHHHDLDHERAREAAVHGLEKRNTHRQRIGQGGEKEEGDYPLEVAVLGEGMLEEEREEDDHFLQEVGGNKVVVHGVNVVGGDEVEGEEGHGEHHHEPVDPRALVRDEDLPPLHRPIGQDHRHVEWYHG